MHLNVLFVNIRTANFSAKLIKAVYVSQFASQIKNVYDYFKPVTMVAFKFLFPNNVHDMSRSLVYIDDTTNNN